LKPQARLVIKNGSNSDILLKVMTTAPSNYMVKPAKAAIKAFRSLSVDIVCNYALDSSVSVFTAY
jgi:MSP (Major sperm protein) domain